MDLSLLEEDSAFFSKVPHAWLLPMNDQKPCVVQIFKRVKADYLIKISH